MPITIEYNNFNYILKGGLWMEIAVLFGSFFIMCLIGVPVAFSLALSSVFVGTYLLGRSPVVMVQQLYRGMNSFPLLAIPLFLLVGQLMNSGFVTDRLIKLARSLVGHIKGGLGHINVVVSMFFAGISGSSTADTAGIGSVLIPAMIKENYSKEISVAVTAASSTLGSIIPPSIMMIVYGAIGGVSIGGLFLGGAIPGILIGVTQMIIIYIYAKKNNYPSFERASGKEIWKSFKGGILPLFIPIIIIGGVIGGFFTATESAMVAVIYALILILLIYKSLKIKDLPKLFTNAVFLYAQPLLAIGAATVFGWLLAYLQAPELMVKWAGPMLNSPEMTLGFIVILFMVVGTFMDAVPAIIIFLPIIQELGIKSGIHPVHMGVVVTMTLALGLITPPYGLCLMFSCKIAKLKIKEGMKTIGIFYSIFILILIMVIFFPKIILFLPKLIMPKFV